MRISSLPFRWKIALPAVIAGMALLVGLAVALAMLARAGDELDRVERHQFPTLQLAQRLEARVSTLQRQLQDAAAKQDAALVKESDATVADVVASLDGAPPDVMDQSERERLKRAVLDYHHIARATTMRIVNEEPEEAVADALRSMAERFNALRADLAGQTEKASLGFREGLEQARSLQRRSVIALVVIVVASALASAALGLWLARSAARPLEALTSAARRIAQGDLTHEVAVESADEIGVLAASFGTMVGRLREVVSTLKTSSSDLAGIAKDLADQMRAQSALAERQASGIAQTSVSTRELEQTANVAASRAASVLDVARRAAEMSESGHGAAERSIEGIKQIQGTVEDIVSQSARMLEQARAVGDIVATVRDLAEQSHVLSLNASIEAARAGEAGKSFGVVAAEVRSLAEQSGAGAARIGKIVKDMLDAVGATMETTERGSRGVEGSVAQIRASGESLREIGGIVRETSDAALQIASAVQQQSTGIAQIARAMQDLDSGMDEAVSRIQELEKSASDLAAAAVRISTVADEFRI